MEQTQISSFAEIAEQYTRLILEGDRGAAQHLVFGVLDQGATVRDIYLKIFQPSLYEVGRQWEAGQLSIAREHLATAVTQSVLSSIYSRVSLPPHLSHHAVVACLSGNYHEIGPRMLADFLQMAGYNTRFLGSNTPIASVLELIDELKPDVIGLPATTPEHVEAVRRTIELLRADFNSYRPVIMVGGLAFNASGDLWKRVQADLWGLDAGQAVDRLTGGNKWG
ncbi:MAG TPA: cobalamin-dependent protein [Aggregatilineaceae bacterium]|nr:cobalamin-dependent protein [Aggregatilineaceae bacterium]